MSVLEGDVLDDATALDDDWAQVTVRRTGVRGLLPLRLVHGQLAATAAARTTQVMEDVD